MHIKRLSPWLAAAAILVVIFGTQYAVVQQAQRLDANSPQIQIAEDTAMLLNSGAKPASLVSSRVDIRASLAPFVIIYNRAGQVISGSGYLNGEIPTAPLGLLTNANGREYNWVTWQPTPRVRIASVSVAARGYYVLSGRSLRQVEIDENKTLQLSLAGGVLCLIILSGLYAYWYPSKTTHR